MKRTPASWKVLKFLGAGLLTALLDNGIFFLMHRTTGVRFLSLAVSTVVSVAFNYIVVRAAVFETRVDHSRALPKYLGVHTAGLFVRWAILEAVIKVFHIAPKHWGIYAAKLVADAVVYSLKYIVQRDFVFREKITHTKALKSELPATQAQSETL